MHVYRWDLDKTYLDTDIDSFRGLLRAAVQTASQKRNVPGSAALLRALQKSDPDAEVFVLSGSPTQMRTVLQAKLLLDGIRVDHLVLKDNLGNLRRGRLRAVKDQLGYKLPQLLLARAERPHGLTETLFGDDSEVDAVVYAAYAAILDGTLDPNGLRALLRLGRVYDDVLALGLEAASRIKTTSRVEDIFIRVEKGVPLERFDLLGDLVTPIFSWLQAALRLHARGRLDPDATIEVIRVCAEEGSRSPTAVGGLIQDAVRRRITDEASVRALLEAPDLEEIAQVTRRSLDRLNGHVNARNARTQPDFAGFMKGH